MRITKTDRFKLALVQAISLLGFVLFCVRYGWEQVEAFVRWAYQ